MTTMTPEQSLGDSLDDPVEPGKINVECCGSAGVKPRGRPNGHLANATNQRASESDLAGVVQAAKD